MKHLPLARLGVALAIPLMMAGCEAPEPNHVNSDPAIHAEEHGAGGGWCPLSALATCQAACDQVAVCAVSPFFSEVQRDACAFDCASDLMSADPETEGVITCLSEVTSQHACCEVTGCAASWMDAPSTSAEAVADPEPADPPETTSGPAPPLDVALGGDACPPEARFTTNGAGLAFCLFEGIALPGSDLVTPYCHFVWDDYIGFHWPGSATPEGYECPEGFRTGDNPEGSLFCVYSGLNVPNTPTLRPYCDFLEDGILGYQWCLDPLAASCPQTPLPHPADDPVAPPTESVMETVTSQEEQTQDDQNATPQDEHPGDSNGDDDEVSPGEAAASQEQAGDPSPDEHPEPDPETHDENEPSSDAVIVAPPEGTDSEPAVHEEPHSSLVEEMMEEEEEKPLPSPVSAEPPGDDEEDHRCESMCKRLDHCGGLERSAIPEVQSCVDLCHTWGYAFQNALFGCNLDQAETCQEVLTCWTPGG